MIQLVLNPDDPRAFETLAMQLTPMIKRTVAPFARDRMLATTEDADSLTNLCLLKLHQAHRDFKYESHLSEEHNQRRFIAQVKKYTINILIDKQYLANLMIRKPACGIISTVQLTCDDDDGEYEPSDTKQPTAHQIAVAKETYGRIMDVLSGDEKEIAELIVQNYTAEDVARTLGMKISHVRYLIYSRIQPCVAECCV